MQEIDPSNIVSRRTRGRKIDFAKEAEAAGDELEDDDEEDEEYVHPLPVFVSISTPFYFRSLLSFFTSLDYIDLDCSCRRGEIDCAGFSGSSRALRKMMSKKAVYLCVYFSCQEFSFSFVFQVVAGHRI